MVHLQQGWPLLGQQPLLGQGLGKDGQAIATALGQGAVGVDDQQIEGRHVLERPHQQTVATVGLGPRRAGARSPVTEGGDGLLAPQAPVPRGLGGAAGQGDPQAAQPRGCHHPIDVAPCIVERRHHTASWKTEPLTLRRNRRLDQRPGDSR